MSKDTTQLVEDYVYKNYKTYKDKQLIIRDFGNHFRVYTHKDGSPLILSKEVDLLLTKLKTYLLTSKEDTSKKLKFNFIAI